MITVDQVIIGAGISGMIAAFRAQQAGKTVILLEASDRVGGLMGTVSRQGYLLEAGPHTFPSTALDVIHLCDELGLAPQPVSALARHRYLVKNGQLYPLPHNPKTFIGSQLLSASEKLRLSLEPFQATLEAEATDESVASFVHRRLGLAVLDYLVGPLLTGIYAGDPEQLSIRAVFPLLASWEAQHGSLLKGGIAAMLRSRRTRSSGKRPAKKLQLMGFPAGMQVLVDALHARVAEVLRLKHRVLSLTRQSQGLYHVSVQIAGGDSFIVESSSVVMAIPADEAARLLQSEFPDASGLLSQVEYAPVSVLHIGVPLSQLTHALDGFGFLVPHREALPFLGCIWASSLFPERAPEGHALLTVMVGGALGRQFLDLTPDVLQTQVRDTLAKLLGAESLLPDMVTRMDWPQAIPQYNMGHRDKINAIQTSLYGSGIILKGNYLNGVALNNLAG